MAHKNANVTRKQIAAAFKSVNVTDKFQWNSDGNIVINFNQINKYKDRAAEIETALNAIPGLTNTYSVYAHPLKIVIIENY